MNEICDKPAVEHLRYKHRAEMKIADLVEKMLRLKMFFLLSRNFLHKISDDLKNH